MTTTQTTPSNDLASPKQQLSLFDSTNIIVGIIIGAGIYESVPRIAANVPSLGWLIGVWVLGALLSLTGALCYVELGNMFPEQGGDYVYLTRAYGRRLGFIFAWCQVWVICPGSIGAMAFVFAKYADRLYSLAPWMPSVGRADAHQVALVVYALASVAILSAINLLGVRQGKWTQNLLTVAKVLGLGVVIAVGLLASSPTTPPSVVSESTSAGSGDIALAMMFVLFAYGGWADMAYVGAEIRDPKKNIYRALMLGIVAVTTLYVLATLAFVHSQGFHGVRTASALAADVMKSYLGGSGERFISTLICISALGAINGLIFTSARISYAVGRDHRLFAWLGKWNERLGIPVRSLAAQTLTTMALIAVFGLIQIPNPLNPKEMISGFESMVVFTTPPFWLFMALVGLAIYWLRFTAPDATRPYRLPFYPFTPLIFIATSLWMGYRGLMWASLNLTHVAYWAVGFLVMGILASLYDPRPKE